MTQYKANAVDFKNFVVIKNELPIGELKYAKWYSYNADILLSNNLHYQLKPKGYWNSSIELKDGEIVLLTFKMGWKGMTIQSQLGGIEENYLLKTKSFFSSKFVLIDSSEKELLTAITNLNWRKFGFNYTIDTSDEFELFQNKEVLLLTIVHCINYYITVVSAAA